MSNQPANHFTTVKHGDFVTSVAFGPTGRLLATAGGDTAKVWEISPDGAAPTRVATLAGHIGIVNSVAIDPTGRFLATGSDDTTAKLWKPSEPTDPSAAPHPVVRPILSNFKCPIAGVIMSDPVLCADGHSYDRPYIAKWFATGHTTSPKTGAVLPNLNLVPNHALRKAIEELFPESTKKRSGGRMSRRKHKRSNRKYKKRALRRSRK